MKTDVGSIDDRTWKILDVVLYCEELYYIIMLPT